MPRSHAALVCRGVSVDAETNVLSLFDLLEEVQATINLPADEALSSQGAVVVPLQYVVVALIGRSDPDVAENFVLRYQIQGPSTKALGEVHFNVDLTSHQRVRTIHRAAAIPIEKSGIHQFVFAYQTAGEDTWNEIARYPMQIEVKVNTSTP